MAVKKYKPVTAGTRWRIGNAYAEVTTNEPEKSLLETKKRTGGRNSSGHMTMRYIGGGHKKKYRVIDFKRNKKDRYAILKMPSGELRKVLINCYATVGVVSNSDHSQQSMGKAGRNRWKGIRPRNRGVAMNPVDHPMGGGEGKASGGQPRSRNGQYSRGLKTRKPHKSSDNLIIQRKNGSKLTK